MEQVFSMYLNPFHPGPLPIHSVHSYVIFYDVFSRPCQPALQPFLLPVYIYRVDINYRRISLRSCRLHTVNVTFGQGQCLRPTTSKDTTRIARAHQHRNRERHTRRFDGNGGIVWTSAVSHVGRTSNTFKVTMKLQTFLF
jgi:hypothetical protein